MRYVVAGAVLLVAVVSGCSGSDVPPAEVGPLASEAATASPSKSSNSRKATPPALLSSPATEPSAAVEISPQGASAFARHYMALLNAAFADSDASAVRQVSHPDCEGCSNFIAAIETPAVDGERIEGGDFSVAFAEAREIARGDAIVDIRYSVEPVRVLDAEGKLVEERPGMASIDGQLRLLVAADGGWQVRGFRNAAP